jgi:hypothetical protein
MQYETPKNPSQVPKLTHDMRYCHTGRVGLKKWQEIRNTPILLLSCSVDLSYVLKESNYATTLNDFVPSPFPSFSAARSHFMCLLPIVEYCSGFTFHITKAINALDSNM